MISKNLNSKICVLCGKEFIPKTISQKVCEDKHYRRCQVCGKLFEIHRPSDTKVCCSKQCTLKKRNNTMVERYGVEYALQSQEFLDKLKKTSLERFGVEHAAQSSDIKNKTRKYFEQTYGVSSPFKMPDFQDKSSQTCKDRYGVEYTSQIPSRILKSQQTNMIRYGGKAPLCNSTIRQRAARNRTNHSSLERRLYTFLDEYKIEYVTEYVLSGDNCCHSFDVYLPQYKILIDCDGILYHGYMNDADGGFYTESTNNQRVTCVPEDHIYHVIVESNFEHGLNELKHIIQSLNSGAFDYNGYLFNWCRSIEFPYPQYTDKRLHSDFDKLCKYISTIYKPTCMYGISSIRQFHKSLYHCSVGNHKSIYDAWYDDVLLRKVILNRLIYKNNVDPSMILSGFNISKIAPKVSVFNPVLARYLVNKYLSNFNTIFDPFSGFSGRMLGVCSLNKYYIGQDIRTKSVDESNQIKQYHNLNATIFVADSIKSEGKYPCLFTCPPYSDKEIYIDNQKNIKLR